MKILNKGIAMFAIAAASGSAMAGETTGSVGVVSEYLFRGIESSNGAAVQGSLDWTGAHGISAGVWGSNTSSNGDAGNEADVWLGYGTTVGDFGLDLGAIYYYYSEAKEANGATDPSYPELYVGASVGPLLVRAYYTNDFAGSDLDAVYVMGAVTGEISEGLAWTFQAGISSGDGVKAAFGEEYVDYSVGVARSLGEGLTANLSVVGTDLESASGSDKPKLVVGISKSFGF